MNYQIINPGKELSEVVQYFWKIQVDVPSPDFVIKSIVDDSSGIIIHHQDGKSVVDVNGELVSRAVIYGQSITPAVVRCNEAFSAVGVLFQPHAIHQLFAVDSHLLTNEVFSLEDVMRTESLIDEITGSDDTQTQIQIFSRFLMDRMEKTKMASLRIADIIRFIRTKRGMVTVCDLTDQYHTTERSLERAFLKHVGVTPRQFLKVVKFQNVVRMMKEEREKKLTDIAFDLNFNDQSHLSNVVKKLSGFSPRSLRTLLDDHVVDLFVHAGSLPKSSRRG